MTKARDLANAGTALTTVSATELGYLDGVTSAVQTQIDAKLASSTAATTYVANSLADAKGDLFVASADNTVTRLPVGSTGDTIVADSSTATGLRYQATQAAAKNCIINGGMDIFQRTTSTGFNAYALDRWYIGSSGGVTTTQSNAKVTPNSQFMMLMTAQSTQQIFAYQAVETKNAIYYAGKTVTLSAYAAGLTTTTNLIMVLAYSTSVDNGVTGSWTDITPSGGNANLTLSSTVTRWSATYDVPSTAKSLRVLFVNNAANITVGQGIYLGDVQLEVGSVATAFSRAGGTIQGETSACQRYYFKDDKTVVSIVNAAANINMTGRYYHPVKMRTTPTLTQSGAASFSQNTSATTFTVDANGSNESATHLYFLAGASSGVATYLYRPVEWSAEL